MIGYDAGRMANSTRWELHPTNDHTFERHYTVQELARLWAKGVETVRAFVKADGGDGITHQIGPKGRDTVTIAEPAARRIYMTMLAAGEGRKRLRRPKP